MKKTMFRGITMLLVVVMLMSVSMFPAFAADYETNPSYGQNPYKDVKESDWFYNDVMYCYEHNIMLGVGNGLFAPEKNTTRAEIAQAIYRLFKGMPEDWIEPFTDVSKADWFGEAVNWCYFNGIVYGTSKTTFSPNIRVTREQVVAILYRSAKTHNAAFDGVSYDSFADASKVSDYAKEAWEWSVKYGIILGEEEHGAYYMRPDRNITRAELATVLARFDAWMYDQIGVKPDEPSEPTDPTDPTEPTDPERELWGIRLEFADDAKMVYLVGEPLDLSGMTVYAFYSDGYEEVVEDYTYFGGSTDVAGNDISVMVFYGMLWAEFKITVVEAVPAVERLDMIEARDAGNAHAQEIGFLNCDTSLEPTEDCTCEETTEYYPHNEVMENGGQEYLNQLAEKAADEFKAYLQQRAEENEDIPDDAWMHVTLTVYVSWCDYTQGYKIQVLYR